MKRVMDRLAQNPPKTFAGQEIVSIGNYNTGLFTDVRTGKTTPTGQPASNIFYYITEREDKIIVRPSGTEPKIKIYVLAHDADKATLDERVENYSIDAKKMMEE